MQLWLVSYRIAPVKVSTVCSRFTTVRWVFQGCYKIGHYSSKLTITNERGLSKGTKFWCYFVTVSEYFIFVGKVSYQQSCSSTHNFLFTKGELLWYWKYGKPSFSIQIKHNVFFRIIHQESYSSKPIWNKMWENLWMKIGTESRLLRLLTRNGVHHGIISEGYTQ